MYINNIKYKENLHKLKSDISKYEDQYISLYEAINNLSFYWYDGYSASFFNNYETERHSVDLFLIDLEKVLKKLDSISSLYKKFGNKISIDLSSKDDILSRFNDIESSYKSLNYSYDDLKNIKNDYLSLFNDISHDEDDIYSSFKGTNLSNIHFIDFANLETSNEEKKREYGFFSGFNEQLSVINMELKYEKLLINSIKDDLNEILLCYKSKNNDIINTIFEEINKRFNDIYNNHLNTIIYFDKRLTSIDELVTDIKSKFDDLDINIKGIGE